MKTAYSHSKDCQSGCEHLDRGSCRECVEKALTAYAEERVREACEQTSDTAALLLIESVTNARAEALEEAAKVIQDGHKSQKCVDPEDCPYCSFAKAIRALKDKP